MHSTKAEILALLKRSDGASVDEISASIGLASMTVRQHLTALERDALVQAREVRRPTGRPHFQYSLTEEGHRSVSQGYDRLLALVIDAIGELDVPGNGRARRDVFRSAAEALARKHGAEFEHANGAARIERAVAILRSHGGFAEYHEHDGLFEVRDFSCVFRQALGTEGPCEWHETFLRAALGDTVEAAPEGDECAACCRYVIPARALSAGSRALQDQTNGPDSPGWLSSTKGLE